MPKATKQKETTYRWGWDDESNEPIMLTLEEFIRRLAPMIIGPVRTMHDLDGDMMLSDYQKLSDAAWKIKSLLNSLGQNSKD